MLVEPYETKSCACTYIEDRGQAAASREWLDQNLVNQVIDNVAVLFVVELGNRTIVKNSVGRFASQERTG